MTAKTIIRVVAAAILATGCAACSLYDVSRDELVGDYQLDYGYGVETVRLENDGNYTQLFRLAGDETWTTNSGAWEFKVGRRREVVLQNSLQIEDGAGKLRADFKTAATAQQTLVVKKTLVTLSLLADETRGLAFTKLKQEQPPAKSPPIFRVTPPNADQPPKEEEQPAASDQAK
jgi:hypothetical protein